MWGILFFYSAALMAAQGQDCAQLSHGPLSRDGSSRALPEFGRPKESRVDYKLINQLIMSLQRAIRDGHPLPDGFTAKMVPKTWAESPVGGVMVSGIIKEPHRLAGQMVNIMLQREFFALVVTVQVEGTNTRFEMAMEPDQYLNVFPFQPPAGQGGLLSVVLGVQMNPNLDGWEEQIVDP